jgi:cell shape-determining protein MreC
MRFLEGERLKSYNLEQQLKEKIEAADDLQSKNRSLVRQVEGLKGLDRREERLTTQVEDLKKSYKLRKPADYNPPPKVDSRSFNKAGGLPLYSQHATIKG